MSALTFIEELTAKSVSKLTIALVVTLLLSACGAGGESASSDDVESQTSTEPVKETPAQVAPVQISSNPQSLTLDAGEVANFSVIVSGGGELSFQWRLNEQNIPGATSRILSLANISTANAGLYDVIVSNSRGSETSLTALLTVNTPVTEPVIPPVTPTIDPVVITAQPQSILVEEATTANFTVQVTGDGEITYQWFKDGMTINGATSASLNIPSTDLTDQGAYRVRITNSEGSVVSDAANLNVTPLPQAVEIVSQPQALSVDENAVASFTVEVTGDGVITYQWLKDAAVIEGATSSSYTITNVTPGDAANYSVMVTNSRGYVFSESVSLNVTPVQVASSIELTWDIPQEREDGSDLSLGEINGYVIAYGTDQNNLTNQLNVEGASVTSTVLEQLSEGTYYFAIATIDSDGVQGAYSNVIQQSI